MSHSAGDSSGSADPVQVSHDAVTLDREIEVREEGVVVTYRLSAGDDEAVSATVVDAVPEALPTDDAGFHPDNEPYEWSLDDRDLRFETVVPDEGERIVVFGIAHADEPPDDVSFPEPELSAVDPVNPAVADDDMDITLPDVDEPDRADAIAEVIQGGGDPPEGTVADGGDAAEASSDEIEAALEGLSDPAEEAADDEAPDIDDAPDATDDDADGEPELDLEPDEPAADAPDEASDDADATASAPDDGPTVPESGLVEALVAELESGTVPADDRQALAEAIGVGEGDGVESLDVRLSHVQSRMDDYAAYVDALEDIIDEHGTADGFMTEIREDVDLVDERLEDVHERLDDVESRLDELDADVSDRDEDVAALDDAVDELRSDVETVQQVRDTLLDAFGDDSDGS